MQFHELCVKFIEFLMFEKINILVRHHADVIVMDNLKILKHDFLTLLFQVPTNTQLKFHIHN